MDPRDDLRVIAEREHMMFGFVDPFRAIRESIEAEMPDRVVHSIIAYDDPSWLTIARRDGERSGTVIQFGLRVRAWIAVTTGYANEQLATTVTFLVGGWDDPDHHRRRAFVDIVDDAYAVLDDDLFHRRFLEFRDEA